MAAVALRGISLSSINFSAIRTSSGFPKPFLRGFGSSYPLDWRSCCVSAIPCFSSSKISPKSPFGGAQSEAMAAPDSHNSSLKQVLVPIATGTEEMEAVILIDILRRAGAEVTVASVEEGLEIVASRKVKLVADAPISECQNSKYDLVVLPGGMPGAERLRDCNVLKDIFQQQAKEDRPFAAICAAPAVALESWGLLHGLKATCHPAFTKSLSNSEAVGLRVVRDGQVTTSRGPGTAIEFSLSLVEQLYDKLKVEELSKALLLKTHVKDGPSKLEFNSVNWSSCVEGRAPIVLVPVANGSEEMEAVIIVDILRRAGADVIVGSIEEALQITASRNVQIVADRLVKDLLNTTKFDLIILPGGIVGAKRLRDSEALNTLLKYQAESNRIFGAICAAPAIVLEEKNLLKGKQATTYPAFVDKLSGKAAAGARVVIDGLVATSQGPATAMEFALSIVEKLFGHDKAAGIAEAMVFPYS